jgi:hypothetical protein
MPELSDADINSLYGPASPAPQMTPSPQSTAAAAADHAAQVMQIYRTGQPAARYPDMTPGPTANAPTPDASNPGGSFWDAAIRPVEAARQAYEQTPGFFTPAAHQAVEGTGWLGRNIISPAMTGVDYATKGVAQLGAGLSADLSELGSGGNPQLARDLTFLQQTLPVVTAGMPPPGGPPGVSMGPLPRERLPITTPAQAKNVATGLYNAANASKFRLTPEFTDDFVASLDKYQPQTPAGAATASSVDPTTGLIANLKNLSQAPLDNIASIQDVDQNIQRAISANLNDPSTVRQMRTILRDFRDRYTNVPDAQMTGDPQGITDFNNARNAYAAYSRMNEVQRIADAADLTDNPATTIRTQVRSFLRDPDNTAGWTDAETGSLRQAGETGFLQEWLRAEGSRLVGIGSAMMPGITSKLLGVPAQIALSYAARNAAENVRLGQLQKTMTMLGERVPQPGAVPPAPPTQVPGGLLRTGARYLPLTGLLAQQPPSGT